jgi:membrane fusion protein (multidrug efflux system)
MILLRLTALIVMVISIQTSAFQAPAYAQSKAQKPTPVFVAPVKIVDFSETIEALGTLNANENVNLTSTVTDRITAVSFEDNQKVAKGDVLIEMDASQEEAELAEEQSRLLEAQRQVNRIRPLVKRGASTQAILDERERELATAQARIKAINARLDERRIRAPFDGVVGMRNISVGSLAQPGILITTIDDISKMKLDFSVPEVFLASLRSGLQVEASARAYPDRVFKGTISSIDSRIDPITRAVMARALIDNEEGLLKSGMLMRIDLQKSPRQTLIIPEEAIITAGNTQFVMLVQEGEDGKTIAKKQMVEIGARREGEVEILVGLSEGQQIIIHGTSRVRPGAAVTIKAVKNNNETLKELLNQSESKTDKAE